MRFVRCPDGTYLNVDRIKALAVEPNYKTDTPHEGGFIIDARLDNAGYDTVWLYWYKTESEAQVRLEYLVNRINGVNQ